MKLRLLGTHQNLVVKVAVCFHSEDDPPSYILKRVWTHLKALQEVKSKVDIGHPFYTLCMEAVDVHDGKLFLRIRGYDRFGYGDFLLKAELAPEYWNYEPTNPDEDRAIKNRNWGPIPNRNYTCWRQAEIHRVLMLPLCSDLLRLVASFVITR